VFVLPSLGEGMSNTILESMASGLPVVVTDVGGNPEVVGDRSSGLLFEPGNAAALAQALRGLVDNPELRQTLGLSARERAITKFSLKSMMEQYKEMYLNAAKQRGVRVNGK
jgi:glycosyltransferase involved in cell wall biosynthesis